jgi:tRNA pseudouridine32 synthase / 23S rRNA pseudouridine746 synthase
MAEAIARELMAHLDQNSAGKMYGILIVESRSGELQVLQAFSGLLEGQAEVPGWVPPIPGRSQVAAIEKTTLQTLESLKQALIKLQQAPEYAEYQASQQHFQTALAKLKQIHNARQQQRQIKRNLATADLFTLQQESQRDGMEKRDLKRDRDKVLQPLKIRIDHLDRQIQALKQQRKDLSRQFQTELYAAHSMMNFLGCSQSLQALMPNGLMPTGTGDCCAPKLLNYAATHGLKPIAMAEFWWGASNHDKVQGEFYGACADRCQPLMGFMLSGLGGDDPPKSPLVRGTLNPAPRLFPAPPLSRGAGGDRFGPELEIIFEDNWLIVVNKPSGLLSVPGRYAHNQDSVVSQLDKMGYGKLYPAHRLDQDTSGILLLAKDPITQANLQSQFADRQVQKTYIALLQGAVTTDRGEINLPLRSDPENRPYQVVDHDLGKPCLTEFTVLDRLANETRIEFTPITGRTHQLRVHAAAGLQAPIVGDRLYGKASEQRLHLHAKSIVFSHPEQLSSCQFETIVPF